MYRVVKRLFDLCSSGLLLILISPVLLLLIVLVRIKLGGPVFFIQKRTTMNERVFSLIKFRTMTNAVDANGNLLPDAERKTKFGEWMRSTSLDELPELFNIFMGDMSVIGPRPLLVKYQGYYKESEMARFKVRGGLIPPEVLWNSTEPTWDEQLGWEAEYGNGVSLKFDAKIFLQTFKILLRRVKTDFGNYTRVPLYTERKIKQL